ncbi:hypothetical protein [Pseudochelatococcus sp. G4_1912]|uniref:hypothetical protein n=1 Tax=Pseudochelatococcus sp. G4_1912 TaxID=3114288 RepID=UPI0039C5B1E2
MSWFNWFSSPAAPQLQNIPQENSTQQTSAQKKPAPITTTSHNPASTVVVNSKTTPGVALDKRNVAVATTTAAPKDDINKTTQPAPINDKAKNTEVKLSAAVIEKAKAKILARSEIATDVVATSLGKKIANCIMTGQEIGYDGLVSANREGRGVIQELAKEMPEEMPEEAPAELFKVMAQIISEKMIKRLPEKLPELLAQALANDLRTEMPEEPVEKLLESAQKRASQKLPEWLLHRVTEILEEKASLQTSSKKSQPILAYSGEYGSSHCVITVEEMYATEVGKPAFKTEVGKPVSSTTPICKFPNEYQTPIEIKLLDIVNEKLIEKLRIESSDSENSLTHTEASEVESAITDTEGPNTENSITDTEESDAELISDYEFEFELASHDGDESYF